MNYLQQNCETLIRQCEDGLNKRFFLYPNDITYSLTNRCNSYCIMCKYLSKSYENHTYDNANPFNVNLQQFKKFMPRRSLIGLLRRRPHDNFFKYINKLSIIGGETFLNPHTYDIVKYAKTSFPKLALTILSNGSVPPPKNDDIVKYIDMLGFSIDGCTKETFEKIRTPLKFDHVMRSIDRWVEAREKYNAKISLSFAVALSTWNFAELPGLVQLAHDKKLDFIYVQPMYIHDDARFDAIRSTSLVDMDKDLGHHYLKEAYDVSAATGIRIDTWESIRRMFGYKIDNNEVQEDDEAREFNPDLNRYCQRLWCLGMKFDELGQLDGVCTSLKESLKIAADYNIPKTGTPFEIYNSRGWWMLRKDMLDGKLISDCSECHKGNSYYYELSRRKL